MISKKRFVWFVIFILVSLVVAVISGYIGLDPAIIKSFTSIDPNLVIIFYIILFIILASLSFSVSVMTSLGTLFFLGWEVLIYSMIGILGSSIIDFYVSRRLGREYVRNYFEKKGGKLEKFDKVVEKDSFKTIMILSAIFFVPPSIPNFMGGIMKINLRSYALATFLGNLPNTFFSIYLVIGFLYADSFKIYGSIIGLVIVGFVSLYFYKGEIGDILKIGFPWAFRGKK